MLQCFGLIARQIEIHRATECGVERVHPVIDAEQRQFVFLAPVAERIEFGGLLPRRRVVANDNHTLQVFEQVVPGPAGGVREDNGFGFGGGQRRGNACGPEVEPWRLRGELQSEP